MPGDAARLRREHVEAFVEGLLKNRAPATAHNRYRGCQAFFAWCLEEGEVRESPMARMKPPRLQETPARRPPGGGLRRLLELTEKDRTFAGAATPRSCACSWTRGSAGRAARDRPRRRRPRRGPRRVDGKGPARSCPSARRPSASSTATSGSARGAPDAADPALWLGRKGRLRETGLAKLVRERCAAAGLEGVHPHLFRHAYAHSMLEAGMQETDLMAVAGWRSREMVARYARRRAPSAPSRRPARCRRPTGSRTVAMSGERRTRGARSWRPCRRLEEGGGGVVAGVRGCF